MSRIKNSRGPILLYALPLEPPPDFHSEECRKLPLSIQQGRERNHLKYAQNILSFIMFL